MGTSKSPLQLAAKLKAASTAVALAGTVGVERGARLVQVAEKSASPSFLRNVGKSGKRLGVNVTGGKYEGGGKYLVSATGPWQIVNNDTQAHQIPRQRASASFEGVFGHAVIPGGNEGGVHGTGGVRTRVHHPGTKGTHAWEKTAAATMPLVPKAIEAGVTAALRSVF